MGEETASKVFSHPNPFGIDQKYWKRIQNMRLMDDMLMTAAMNDNIEATQCILRILMEKPDLMVTRVKSQVEFKNLYGRSLRMDVDARESNGDLIDIEIERDKYRATPERSRYHLSIRDTSALDRGEDFEKLPTVYLIFITEKDCYGRGLPLYHIDRVVKETDEYFKDRAHIIYVNAEYEGDDPVGRLMADFRQRDPDKMYNEELANRVRALKNSEEEVKAMSRAMEETYQEGLEDGLEKGDALRGLRDVESLMETLGLSFMDALKALKVPLEEHQRYANHMAQRGLLTQQA